MSEYDKGWIKWILLGAVMGYLIGKCIAVLLELVITNAAVYTFTSLIAPGFAILGLLIVLYRYNKEKEDQLGK